MSFDRNFESLLPPRRDAATLGFGLGFAALGIAGLLEAAGLAVTATSVYPVVLVALGAAGLWRVTHWKPSD